MKRRNKTTPMKNLGNISKNTTVETKLTHAAMLLSYQFEYGINFKERIINITGDIEEVTFDLVDAALTEMESQSKKDITIKINSEGGSTYQAMAIVGRIRESKCGVITKGYGCVMSAATLILAAGTRRREISEYGNFMHHEASYGLEINRHSQNKATVAQVEKEEKFWADCMARFTKKDAKFWYEKGTHIDAHFTPQQLESYGVVDEVF